MCALTTIDFDFSEAAQGLTREFVNAIEARLSGPTRYASA